MTQQLIIKELSVNYQQYQAVKSVSFALEKGTIGCLLGPSGCGKTTVLRAIAGFEKPSQGSIKITDHFINSDTVFLPPEQRNIGMVFQDFALFPHLNVRKNIAFGLRHLSKKEQVQRVNELLELVELSDSDKKYPHQLSGGQQQRIALIRAIAPKPDILLLDEPFSSLDIELREQLAKHIRNILKQENITAILVTHDQHEAFAMADEICVMNEGTIQQHDTAYNLYHNPANRFVADFIGQGVIIPGLVCGENTVSSELGLIHGSIPTGCHKGDKVNILIRPDDIIHDDDAPEMAVVIDKAFRGSDFLYTLRMPSGVRVLCYAPSHHNHKINEPIGIRLDIDHLVIFSDEISNSIDI